MKVAISTQDVTPLTKSLTWGGNSTQAARRVNMSIVQSAVDSSVPVVNVKCGQTLYLFDDDDNLIFRGNIYEVEVNRAKCETSIIAYDNIFVLNKSKTSRKFDNQTPEEITRAICREVGVKVGNLIETGVPVSFIAHDKTAFQTIKKAYDEAAKKTEKKYFPEMTADALNIREIGTVSGVEVFSASNLTDSIYKMKIDDIVNAVRIVDEQGNDTGEFLTDNDSIENFSMFIDIYKLQKDKDAMAEAKSLFKQPEKSGVIEVVPGDFRLRAGYSVIVNDANLRGEFIIKADSHNFKNYHSAKLELEFKNE